MKFIVLSIASIIIIIWILHIYYSNSEPNRNKCGGGIVINDTIKNYNDSNTRVLYNVTK